jgi:4a-hydroxytetrahydrobiopterin dehydratase
MGREKLSAEEIADRLAGLEGWRVRDESLVKRFEFVNFGAALEFVNEVGAVAEDLDHHPDITFGWGYAEILFTTHDAGGITALDFDLAAKVDLIG